MQIVVSQILQFIRKCIHLGRIVVKIQQKKIFEQMDIDIIFTKKRQEKNLKKTSN